VASNTESRQLGDLTVDAPARFRDTGETPAPGSAETRGRRSVRIDGAIAGPVRFPEKLPEEAFYRFAYPMMYLSRRLEERLLELFQKGYVRGTVTISVGNEATALGMALPFRPGPARGTSITATRRIAGSR